MYRIVVFPGQAGFDHAEARGEERLDQRLMHGAVIGECGEHAFGLGVVRGAERQIEALKARCAAAASVRCHHDGIADAKARMHDLVLAARRQHAWAVRLRAVAVAHQHLDLGVEHFAVELDGLFAAAFEKQVGLDVHCIRL